MWNGRISGGEVARDLAGSIGRFEERSAGAVAEAREAVGAVVQLTGERRAYWLREVEARQLELRQCEAAAIASGGEVDCYALVAARDEAQTNSRYRNVARAASLCGFRWPRHVVQSI